MDTLLFYVKNGEKLELSIIIRSRTHSSLTLCSVSRSMYCFVMPQSRPKRSRLFTSTTSTFPARTASVSSCRAGRSRVNAQRGELEAAILRKYPSESRRSLRLRPKQEVPPDA